MGSDPDDPLTPREVAVLRLMAGGFTAKQAARDLGISPRTVEKHIENAKSKLRAVNRVHLIALALTGKANPQESSSE